MAIDVRPRDIYDRVECATIEITVDLREPATVFTKQEIKEAKRQKKLNRENDRRMREIRKIAAQFPGNSKPALKPPKIGKYQAYQLFRGDCY